MVDEMNGWIDGDEYNELLKTTDGGISWEILNPFGSYRDVGNIFFFDSLTGWITVYSEVPYHLTPSISHTSNGCVDWVTQYTGQRDTRINGVFFIRKTYNIINISMEIIILLILYVFIINYTN